MQVVPISSNQRLSGDVSKQPCQILRAHFPQRAGFLEIFALDVMYFADVDAALSFGWVGREVVL